MSVDGGGGGGGGRGTLRFKHKLPVEMRGPEGVHVVHGSTGTLLTSDLNSLPEDDQRVLARSLETLNASDGGGERNARTESAKSTPLHRNKVAHSLSGSPLERLLPSPRCHDPGGWEGAGDGGGDRGWRMEREAEIVSRVGSL
ncbi:hypothetical protein CRUP_021201 [Coryphaenoides rupestris]|nr:hypothetical protein CRUP_021201 [Coryphaenoides rupestris]